MSANCTVQYLQGSSESLFLVCFTSIQCAIGSIANAVVIAYFLSIRKKHSLKPADKLTLNLAVADFVALTTYVPWRAYLLDLRTKTKNSPYYTSLFVTCLFSTGNALLLMALTRLFAVLFPIKYRTLSTGKVVNRSIFLTWITAIALGVVHRVSLHDIGDFHIKYEYFLSCISFCQPVSILVVYVAIVRSARRARKLLPQERSVRRISWTTYFIVMLCYATFFPYTVYRIVSKSNESITNNQERAAWRWIIAFSLLNSCINPFLYCLTTKRFRLKLAEFFKMTPKRSETNRRNVDGHVLNSLQAHTFPQERCDLLQ